MAVKHKKHEPVAKAEDLQKKVDSLEAELKVANQKIEEDKKTQSMTNMAIFELYSEIESLKSEKVNK